MADTKNSVIVRAVIIILLVLAVIGSYTGHMDRGLDFLGLGKLAQANDDYLVSSFNREELGVALKTAKQYRGNLSRDAGFSRSANRRNGPKFF